jgi:hypothetical protein
MGIQGMVFGVIYLNQVRMPSSSSPHGLDVITGHCPPPEDSLSFLSSNPDGGAPLTAALVTAPPGEQQLAQPVR